MEDLKVAAFLETSYGYGYGYGSGYCYGDGYGNGNGHGSSDGSGYGYGYGNGCGYGDGSGYCYGDGSDDDSGIRSINGRNVHIVDGIQTIFDVIHGNVAKGWILKSDLTLRPCYIVKQDNVFAHGDTLRGAMAALTGKLMQYIPEEERIAAFVKEHVWGSTYPNTDYFEWHHRLTGSCEAGREAFAKDKGIDLQGSMTVEAFIELTENAYGGSIIKKLRKAYTKEENKNGQA